MYIDNFHRTGNSPHHQHKDGIPTPLLGITICLEGVTFALLGYSVGLPTSLQLTSLDSLLYTLAEPGASKFLVVYPFFCLTLSFFQKFTIGLLVMLSSKPLALNA